MKKSLVIAILLCFIPLMVLSRITSIHTKKHEKNPPENKNSFQIVSGKWIIGNISISPVNEGKDEVFLVIDETIQSCDPWVSLKSDFTIGSLDAGGSFGIVFNFNSPEDYQLLRIYSGEAETTLQMLHWKYGYFRQWYEVKCGPLQVGKKYSLSIVPAPPIDKEDWRLWKLILEDKQSNEILIKTGIENYMPAFGLGTPGLYALNSNIIFTGYDVEGPKGRKFGAALKLPSVFSDGAVLQHSQTNPIWGYALPRKKVKIKTNNYKTIVYSNSMGQWNALLPGKKAGLKDKITISSGKEKVIIDDIIYGEVWLASGQSNMEMKLWETDVMASLSGKERDSDIRLFFQSQWPSENEIAFSAGEWQKADGDKVGRWSAVAYAFAEELKSTLGIPVGIIGSYWGGTAIESWIPRSELVKDPLTKPIHDRYLESIELLEKGLPLRGDFPWVWDNAGQSHTPGNLFNGMIHPNIPYGIKGVIWYQGESNTSKVKQYGHLFPMLVDSWRERWDKPDLAFYFVQLAGYDGGQSGAEIEHSWPHLRDEQRKLLDKRKNTGMMVALHLGDSLDIHPPRKFLVGKRLADIALHDVYGCNDRVRSGPLPDRFEFGEGNVKILFREVANGLRSSDGNTLSEFLIAGDDKIFYPARAVINPDLRSVTVLSPQVANPIAVRYGWGNYVPSANLENSAGLPASPFRSDDWPMPTDENY